MYIDIVYCVSRVRGAATSLVHRRLRSALPKFFPSTPSPLPTRPGSATASSRSLSRPLRPLPLSPVLCRLLSMRDAEERL